MKNATGQLLLSFCMFVGAAVGCGGTNNEPITTIDGGAGTGGGAGGAGGTGGLPVGGAGGTAGGTGGMVPVTDGGIALEGGAPPGDGGSIDAPGDGPMTTTDGPLVTTDTGTPAACGMPGQPCCTGNSCMAGGCCAQYTMGQQRCVANGAMCFAQNDPNGAPTGGTCSNGVCSGCGNVQNQTCCDLNRCTGASLVCNTENDRCIPCGTSGGPCCPGRVCSGNAMCVGGLGGGGGTGTCMGCGGPGEPCCANRVCNNGGCCTGSGGDEECTAQGTECPGSGDMCMAGRCAGCGITGMPCCGGRICYEANVACSGFGNGMCAGCGAVNQPACSGNSCNAGLCRNADGVCIAAGTMCGGGGGGAGTCTDTGSCSNQGMACGGPMQPCCGFGNNDFCSKPGTTCVDPPGAPASCLPCGEKGQRCCDPGNTCKTGTCSQTFGVGTRE